MEPINSLRDQFNRDGWSVRQRDRGQSDMARQLARVLQRVELESLGQSCEIFLSGGFVSRGQRQLTEQHARGQLTERLLQPRLTQRFEVVDFLGLDRRPHEHRTDALRLITGTAGEWLRVEKRFERSRFGKDGASQQGIDRVIAHTLLTQRLFELRQLLLHLDGGLRIWIRLLGLAERIVRVRLLHGLQRRTAMQRLGQRGESQFIQPVVRRQFRDLRGLLELSERCCSARFGGGSRGGTSERSRKDVELPDQCRCKHLLESREWT